MKSPAAAIRMIEPSASGDHLEMVTQLVQIALHSAPLAAGRPAPAEEVRDVIDAVRDLLARLRVLGAIRSESTEDLALVAWATIQGGKALPPHLAARLEDLPGAIAQTLRAGLAPSP